MSSADPTPRPIVKHYSNGEVTVVWQPALCIHSKKCVQGLPAVFDFERRPWIDPTAASSAAIERQIETCPSGALSYFRNADRAAEPATLPVTDDVRATVAETRPTDLPRVEVSPGGPLLVHGPVLVCGADGQQQLHPRTALCRCGQSANKPYCDGSHKQLPADWDQAGPAETGK
ncbi:(4Fe-4S)-binding protein [Hymenobacter persicinus]|uniref:Iron-binding zinc finger CDGSH type domain-containing protein n=1 Tax=Hymenobacter persicinus TaxID=2025506 RepID=A0A4Q5LHV1_9BACT|nr:(4Fe-4S)-binding protein [Hymenobacter persicinus]RYU84315.1 hypothetical protein EWM57_01070 [Hymenobacter persicinus]